MIGTQANAAAALLTAPTTFDSGSRRRVYLIDGVIYKVQRDSHHTITCNETEFDNFLRLSETALPAGIRIPFTNLFWVNATPVIAMEYIEGMPLAACYCIPEFEECTDMCMPDEVERMVSPYLGDTGGMNVIFDGTSYWIIDMEF